jgi:hypothetical protein
MIDLNREYSDAELLAMKPHKWRQHPDCYRAPPALWEAVETEDPRALELNARWSRLHYPDKYDKRAEVVDEFAALMGDLEGQQLWHESRGENGELLAVHPNASWLTPGSKARRQQEDAWEAKSKLMHANQDHSSAVPEEKPDPSGPTRKRIVRGD